MSGLRGQEDMLRRTAIGEGHVPATCIADGFEVWIEVRAERDPCGACDADREKCGGRARLSSRDSGGPDVHRGEADAATYREGVRAMAGDELTRICREAEGEKK